MPPSEAGRTEQPERDCAQVRERKSRCGHSDTWSPESIRLPPFRSNRRNESETPPGSAAGYTPNRPPPDDIRAHPTRRRLTPPNRCLRCRRSNHLPSAYLRALPKKSGSLSTAPGLNLSATHTRPHAAYSHSVAASSLFGGAPLFRHPLRSRAPPSPASIAAPPPAPPLPPPRHP